MYKFEQWTKFDSFKIQNLDSKTYFTYPTTTAGKRNSGLPFAYSRFGVLFLICFQMAIDLLENFHIFLCKNKFFENSKSRLTNIIFQLSCFHCWKEDPGTTIYIQSVWCTISYMSPNSQWYFRKFSYIFQNLDTQKYFSYPTITVGKMTLWTIICI